MTFSTATWSQTCAAIHVAGVEFLAVQIIGVTVPEEMRHALALQAVAERARRVKVIATEAEFQAAARLVEAATALRAEPAGLYVRWLLTLERIGHAEVAVGARGPSTVPATSQMLTEPSVLAQRRDAGLRAVRENQRGEDWAGSVAS